MASPYAHIIDNSKPPIDPEDRRRLGLVTATLILRQQEWLHRRVEHVTFEDADLMRRSNSVDFTIPRWVLEILGVKGTKPIMIAVPVTLFRKNTLVHFNLNDEHSGALPLLLGPQAATLAGMALLASAELVLNNGDLPSSIVDDMNEVASADPDDAYGAQARLFSQERTDPQMREELQQHNLFSALVSTFIEHYIAAVVVRVRLGQRRVIHFAYDEPRVDIAYGRAHRLSVAFGMLAGRLSHTAYILASGGDAASYHIESEAPEGLMISTRETIYKGDKKPPDHKVDSFRRSHVHYSKLARTSRLAVRLRISPLSSTIIRVGALTSALTLIAVLFARVFVHSISQHGRIEAMAIVLSVPTLLSVYVLRTDEHPATTRILWPIRIVATAPGILGLSAAAALAGGGNAAWSKIALDALAGLLAVATWILMLTWHRAARRQRRRTANQ